ncbi:hypothetical protein MKW92_039175 [Papaver armeniacum]|nr:hypothetical protein MKW92_039175 [Papaver armeniacum]
MACRRAVLFGTNSRSSLYKIGGGGGGFNSLAPTTTIIADRFPICSSSLSIRSSPSLSPHFNGFHYRQISQMTYNGKQRAFLVDTLALVRKLEKEGFESKHAEAITDAVTQVLSDSLENVAQLYVSNGEMQKIQMSIEADISKFKSQVNSSQEHNFSQQQRETEKLRSDIEKMRSELRYEIDKVTAGQRLDLNLERGRIRDELANQNAETSNLTNKLDREIHALRAQLEAAKYDVIKYCIGTLVSISAVGLAIIRVLM